MNVKGQEGPRTVDKYKLLQMGSPTLTPWLGPTDYAGWVMSVGWIMTDSQTSC